MKKILIAFVLLLWAAVMQAQVADSSRRQVKLQGAVNFRDVGGYATKDGRHVAWGRIYRSDALARLSDDDVKKLGTLSLACVADFRGPYEVKAAPDRLPAGATRISLPAGSENVGDSNYMKNMLKAMTSDSSLRGFYANTSPFHDRYKPVFDALLALPKDSALLFHCTAGKDRTGIAAALLLYALGVDEGTIMQDYLATNYYRRAENVRAMQAMIKGYGMSEETAKKMMAAREDYLQATFTAIKQQYGSIDAFLQKEMGLDKARLEKLRRLYLD